MLYHLEQSISNSLTEVFEPAFGQRVKYTANTATVSISTANSNRDGTGTIADVITGSGSGTLINTITITATGSVTMGMVRLYIRDGTPTFTNLIAEVPIPERARSGIDQAFSITLQVDFMLKTDWKIAASTQNGETFIITAEGLNTAYP